MIASAMQLEESAAINCIKLHEKDAALVIRNKGKEGFQFELTLPKIEADYEVGEEVFYLIACMMIHNENPKMRKEILDWLLTSEEVLKLKELLDKSAEVPPVQSNE